MRPAVGSDAIPARSHKLESEVKAPTLTTGQCAPTSFFIATEDTVLDRIKTKATDLRSDSTFGVRSFEETFCEAEPDNDHVGDDGDEDIDDDSYQGRRRSTLKASTRVQGPPPPSFEQASPISKEDSSASRPYCRPPSLPSASQSLTALSQVSPVPGSSFPSSPKSTSTRSYGHSDEESMDDGFASQAIASSEDDDMDSPSEIQDSAPQLVMPSIKMPSRRPFTERGKGLGRLKVLIAGDSGVGKTSLIKSIVQTCEDIVHVDPLSSVSLSVERLQPRKSKSKQDKTLYKSTDSITEVYASTKPYPPWWSEIEESKILRRRKSMGDTVLERNLCFVDTPGYSRGMSITEGIESVTRYVEGQWHKTCSMTSSTESELLSMLSGNGGTQVDVVLYLIMQELKPADLVFLRRLSSLTNIIPLVAKADLLSKDDVQTLKATISGELHTEGLRLFNFSTHSPTTSPPYTICSAPSNDEENMDASLLMSPEYVQPLLPSELATFVEHIFNQDSISWLKHSAVMKFLYRRRTSEATYETAPSLRPSLIPLNTCTPSHLSSTASSASSSQIVVSYAGGASSYSQARIADHTQREERLAQIQLAKWASDLQQSLRNERARYEAIIRGERAIWLTERLGECVYDGSLVPTHSEKVTPVSEKGLLSLRTSSAGVAPRNGFINPSDPLGLMRWNEAMKRRGWIAFQVMGSFGVLGALAVWVAKSWGVGTDGCTGWNWGWWGCNV